MMRINSALRALTLSTLLAGFGAFAPSIMAQSGASLIDLSQNQLPVDAQWFVHANVAGLRQSKLLAPLYEDSLGDVFEDIADDTGLDLSQEIQAVTAFGSNDQPDSATVVLHGISQPAQLAMLDVLAEHVSLQEMDYAGVSYFLVTSVDSQPRKLNFDQSFMISFGPEQTIITSNLSSLQGFIDAGSRMLGAEQPAGDALLVLRASQSLVSGGLRPGGMSGGPFDSSLLENIDQLGGVVSESAAGLTLFARVYARDDATASYVNNILQGLVSLKALDGGSDPAIIEAIDRLSITSSGPEVTLEMMIPPDLAAELADEL